MKKGKVRLLVIGFDGLDYEIFKKVTKINLNILPMVSPVAVTGPAWTSIYTGDSVTTHKVRDGWGRERSQIVTEKIITKKLRCFKRDVFTELNLQDEFRTYSTTDSTYLWDELSRHGHSSKLYNLPITYPPRDLNSIHVAGFPIPKDGTPTKNPDAPIPDNYYEKSDLVQRYCNPIEDGMGRWRETKSIVRKKGFRNVLKQLREDSFDIAEAFVEANPANFSMIQFSFIDRLGHVFGIDASFVDKIKHNLGIGDSLIGPSLMYNIDKIKELFEKGEKTLEAYDLVDELISFLTDRIDFTDVLIISDHGFRGYDHREKGVLAYKGEHLSSSEKSGMITVKDIAPTILQLYGIEKNCDGRVLHEIITNEKQSKKTSKIAVTQQEKEEHKKIKKRLKDLGYF